VTGWEVRPGIAMSWLTMLLLGVPGASVASAADCSAQAETLQREKMELPRLEVATPADRPPDCITLETVIAFVIRLRLQVIACPHSTHADSVAEWGRTRSKYSKLFNQYRCRRTL
jgi:hypothetical protein